jgi:hypothetical protein
MNEVTVTNSAEARKSLSVKLEKARMNLAALDEARTEIAFEAHTIGGMRRSNCRK